jgi:di/tricarboxylate transporter
MHIAPGALSRSTEILPNNMLAIMASDYALNKFVEANELDLRPAMQTFAEALTPTRSGMSEIVLPPSSDLIGKTPRELSIRTTYGLTLLVIYRDGENLTNISDEPFHSGDTMIAHSPWEALQALEDDRNFVILTDDYPRKEDSRPKKLIHALVFFALALFLVIFTDLRLSVALLTGAAGMILTGVISIDEAYDAVSWKTVFLLASLIPLGIAVENSGTANWIADRTLNLIGDVPDTVLLAVIAILSTFFTLVMSNVGATVLLVPLAINIAMKVGANPAVFAITVALATSNSFIIPTHQVNALLMGPGGYSVADYLKAGGIMTVLFLVVMLFMVNLIF